MKDVLSLFARMMAGSTLLVGMMGTLNIVFDQDWGIRSGSSVLALPKHPIELAVLVLCLFLVAGLLELAANLGSIVKAIKQKPRISFGIIALLTAVLVIGGNFGLTMLMGGPLQRAVEMGNTEQVVTLVEQNSYETEALNKPLYFALKQADYTMAEALVKAGADVDQIDDGEFETPLLLSSVFHFEEEAIAFLLNNGANPNLQDNLGRTAMIVAVTYREDEAASILERLHEAGGELSIEDNNGKTVNAIAARNNNTAILAYLNQIRTQAQSAVDESATNQAAVK